MADKTHSIEEIRAAVLVVQRAVEQNCSTMAKAKRARVDEAVANLIVAYNLARAEVPIKPAMARWIINPLGGWPQSETDSCPPGRDNRKKLMFNPDENARRRRR